MKITPESIGNYSLKNINYSKPSDIAFPAKTDTEKIDLTKNERKYFSGIYPDRKEEIINYHFYKKTGQMHGVSVGSLIDKRG